MKSPKVNIKHILYTTEFSDNALKIRAYALKMAKKFGAKLTLLHVIPDELEYFFIFDAGMERTPGLKKRMSLMKEHFQNSKKEALIHIKSVYGEAIEKEGDIVIEKGNPAPTILRVAKDRKCDLIVMGIKGRGTSKMDNEAMGDTVRHVLHSSQIPVFVVE